MRQKIILFFGVFIGFTAFSQNDGDLFRYSKTRLYGDARFNGMGGSMGALGANFGASQTNPGGFGRFSNDQISVGFNQSNLRNQMTFNGIETNTNRGLFNLDNFGIVFNTDESTTSTGFVYSQIALGYNRSNKFNSTYQYEGPEFNSQLDYFAGIASGFYPDELNTFFPFTTNLAYNNNSLEFDSSTLEYYPKLTLNDTLYHNRSITNKGGMGEYYAALSGNYMNVLYIGGLISINSVRYESDLTHQETVINPSGGTQIETITYRSKLSTRGTGTKIKIGAIYTPLPFLRFGLAFHSPTYYELTDESEARMSAIVNGEFKDTPATDKPEGEYKYRLRTPTKSIGSVAFVYGKTLAINLDVEHVNYKTSNFRTTTDPSYQPYNFIAENAIAKEVFKRAINARIGGEYNLSIPVTLRAGLGFSGSAYKRKYEVDPKIDKFFTLGIGYKYSVHSFDFSFRYDNQQRNYYTFLPQAISLTEKIYSILFSYRVVIQ